MSKLCNEPIEEQVKRIMADFRQRRMKHMVDHPESIENEDLVPHDLSRHAEAVAITVLVRGDCTRDLERSAHT